MRNLKRALSLTLASVMLLGMMVIGTSAASFTDADQISNVTAATVLQELEVMQGSNGKFSPNQTVTRGQMAILICKMLYGSKLNAENFAGTSQFTDVPANAYYTGYVNLASQLGIISGYGNGKFGPGAPVTTAQAALMLTRALGWFQAGELENQSWSSNAIAAVERATSVNLFGDLRLANDAPLSRDNVAEMVFNALTKTAPVNYNERWGVYYSDESSIMSGVKFDYSNSLGYKNFTLVYNTTKSDDFGRPSTEWGIGNGRGIETDDHGDIVSATIRTSILKAADEADASYTAEVKGKDLYGDLGLSETTRASVILDGVDAADFTIQKSSNTALPDSGNGVLVEAYKDSDNDVTIVMMKVYSGKISKVTPAKDNDDRYVTVDGKNFDTEGFAKDDIVIYTVADGAIKTMALADKVSDASVTRVKEKSEFTAGGTTYKFNKTTKDSDKNDVKVGSVLDLYLDANGYVVKVDVSKSTTDYAYVLDTRKDTGYSKDANWYAKLLLTDGTIITDAKLDKDNCKKANGTDSAIPTDSSNTAASLNEKIVEYTKTSKDVYSLTVKNDTGLTAVITGQSINIEKGKAGMVLNGTSGTNNAYADSKTVFLIKDGDNWAAYTGYNNVPDLDFTYSSTPNATQGSSAVYVKDGVAKVVVVADVSAGTDDIVYVLASKVGKLVKEDGMDDYYEYPAVVNGEITTVKAKARVGGDNGTDAGTDKLYKNIVYSNAEQKVIDFDKSTEFTASGDERKLTGTVTKAYGSDSVGITPSASSQEIVAVAEDVQVFAVTSGDKIESGDMDDLVATSVNPAVTGTTVDAIVKDGKVVTVFYQKTAVTPTTPSGTIGGDEVKKDTTMNSKTGFAQKAPGSYIFTNASSLVADGDAIHGTAEQNMFFVTKTTGGTTFTATLTIKNAKGTTVYSEYTSGADASWANTIKTPYFYVQLVGEVANKGDGSLKTTALTSGTYTWTIAGNGIENVSGEFTIG